MLIESLEEERKEKTEDIAFQENPNFSSYKRQIFSENFSNGKWTSVFENRLGKKGTRNIKKEFNRQISGWNHKKTTEEPLGVKANNRHCRNKFPKIQFTVSFQ